MTTCPECTSKLIKVNSSLLVCSFCERKFRLDTMMRKSVEVTDPPRSPVTDRKDF